MFKIFCSAAALFLASVAQAASYPQHPVTLVVPFSAGGPTDRVARDFAEVLGRKIGQPVIVENSAGAGGNIGAMRVARAAPDGYMLLLHNMAMATGPGLYKKLGYKPLDDFEYLGMVVDVPMTLIGRPTLKEDTFDQFKAHVLAEPGKLTIGNAGIGSAAFLCGLVLQQSIKANMVVVPYKGTANAMADLLGGQIDFLCDQTTSTLPLIAAGSVKVFGVSSASRLPLKGLQDKPTFREEGVPGASVQVWHGLYAPKGTPAAVTARLNEALRSVLADKEFKDREQSLGAVVITDDRVFPRQHKEFVAAEIRKWTPLLEAAGVQGN